MDGVKQEGCCNGYAACAARFTGCTETDGVVGGRGGGMWVFLCTTKTVRGLKEEGLLLVYWVHRDNQNLFGEG